MEAHSPGPSGTLGLGLVTDPSIVEDQPAGRPPGNAWRIADVTAHLGLTSESTVRAYLARKRMPPADGRDRYGPWWRPRTITAWHAARPRPGGHGVPRLPKKDKQNRPTAD